MTKSISATLALLFFVSIFYLYRYERSVPIDENTIIVGTNAEYPPYTFIKNDEIVGFDIDVAREAVKRMNKKMVLQDMPFDALIPAIQLGKVHMLAAGMTPTAQKAKRVHFTKPHLKDDPLIIVTLKETTKINNVDDLKGKNVIVNEGYTADFYMTPYEKKGVDIKRLSAPAEAFLALKSKRAAAFVTARSSVQLFFEQYGKQDYRTVLIEGASESYALAISKKHPDLLPQIQKVLDEMEQDGTLDTLRKKWKL